MHNKFKQFLRDAKLYFDYDTHGSYIFSSAVNEYVRNLTTYWKSLNKQCKNIIIPSLVQKKIFSKQIETFMNNKDECLYQTNSEYLKATSEPVLYNSDFYRTEIKTKNSLPVKHYMYNTVYRKQSRTNPLIRHNEIFMFLQIHEAYSKQVDSTIIMQGIIEKYRKLVHSYLGIPTLILERPDWDKFTGAVKTIAFDTIVDDKRLQVATVHDLGTNFSQLYNLKYLVENQHYEYVHQFSHGCSQRLLYATFYHHYKNNRLELPEHLRLIELILVKDNISNGGTSITDKRVNLVHEIKAVKLKKFINELSMRDSIILIKYSDSEQIKIVDRDNIFYIHVNLLPAYRLKKPFSTYIPKTIEISSIHSICMTVYNENLLYDKTLWGFTLDKTTMYMGPSY